MKRLLAAFLFLLAHAAVAAPCTHRLLVSGFFSTVHVYDACTGAYLQDLDSIARLEGPQAIRIGPDGLVYVVSEGWGKVYRYRADTLAFVDVFVTLPAFTNPIAVDFDGAGVAYIAGFLSNDVRKFSRTGEFIGNAFPARASGINGPELGTGFGPDGNLYVPGYNSSSVIRYDPRTNQTSVAIAARQAGIFQPRGLVSASDGATMLLTTEGSGQLLRFNPATGELVEIRRGLDAPKMIAYGPGGEILMVESTGVSRFDPVTFARLGTLVANGSGGLSFATFAALVPYPAADAPNTVVEFRNSTLNHYFITADPNEAGAVDRGAAGPGWSRTGATFKAGGSAPVCRFYGSQSPGPNSHFYTIDAGECQALKNAQATTPATDKRWNFEHNDFLSTPAVSGTCPVSTVPVYRAYNNGFAKGLDSNHRITSDKAAIDQTIAGGWKDEGVVMCAPR